MGWKVQGISLCLLPLLCTDSPSIHTAEGTLLTINEPASTHQYQPKCTVYTGVHSRACTLCRCGQMDHACICHFNMAQNSFTALKTLCPLPSIPPSPPAPLLFLLSVLLPFPECHGVGILWRVWPFQTGSFHLVICI